MAQSDSIKRRALYNVDEIHPDFLSETNQLTRCLRVVGLLVSLKKFCSRWMLFALGSDGIKFSPENYFSVCIKNYIIGSQTIISVPREYLF
jgi:hypothetical protein